MEEDYKNMHAKYLAEKERVKVAEAAVKQLQLAEREVSHPALQQLAAAQVERRALEEREGPRGMHKARARAAQGAREARAH